MEYSFDSDDNSYTACLFPHEALFSWRCCKVDLRRDDDRFGMLENEVPPVTDCAENSNSGIFVSSWISNFGDDVGPWSKTLKSLPNVADPCRLLRFATGLPRLAWSRFMIASLRFNGLDVEVGVVAPSCVPSNLASAWLIGALISGLSVFFSRFCAAIFFDSVGLVFSHFFISYSSRSVTPSGICKLSRLLDSPVETRLSGLLGEVRTLDVVGEFFARFADRSDSFTLGGKGFASGEGAWVGVPKKF